MLQRRGGGGAAEWVTVAAAACVTVSPWVTAPSAGAATVCVCGRVKCRRDSLGARPCSGGPRILKLGMPKPKKILVQRYKS
jgi:hypothetical protein